MPAHPKVQLDQERLLRDLGERVRLARLRRRWTAQQVATEAGITRVTLHRLEAGAASTTLGTLVKVLGVLGLAQDLVLPARDDHVGHDISDAQLPRRRTTALPQHITLDQLPELQQAAWHLADKGIRLTPEEVFELYERNWRHIDRSRMGDTEARLLDRLTKTVGKGVMLV